jgi:capsular exopolysaccharide synthesis family protein
MSENQALSLRAVQIPAAARPPAVPVFEVEAHEFDSFSYLRTYWNIFQKRLSTVATVTFLVTFLVALASFKMTPVYQAGVRLDIEADTLQIQSLNDLFRQVPTDESFIGTQIQVLEGDNLATRTIEQLGLARNAAAAAAIQQASSPFASRHVDAPEGLLGPFRHCLRVQRVRDSHVVIVSFESTDANISAAVANALANNYIENNFRQKYDATRQASGWMEQQLDELKAKVEKSQQALVDYERANAIVNIGDKENVVEQRLSDLSRDLTSAQNDRLQKESLYDLVRANESQVVFIAQNDLLQRLEEKYADLKAQYVDALEQYGRKHPKVERLQGQVDEIQSMIQKERKRIVESIHNDYLAALGREKLLQGAVGKEKLEVGVLSQLLIQHNLLKREFETNQQLYDSLLQRLKDATVSAGLRATNIHVIDPAKPPKMPIRPQKLVDILIGMMGGFVLALALAFIQEAVDTTIKSIEEAERLAGAPALAVVPLAREALYRPNNVPSIVNGVPPPTPGLALLNQPSSAVAESFRTLLTSVILSTAPQPPQVLLVTSAAAHEGKTVTAVNLAIALAQRGEPTLLIDADLRHSTIATSLTLSNSKGLATVLSGASPIEEAVCRFSRVPNLWTLPTGPRPANPAQLLSSSAMTSLVEDLRKRFKFLVIDSPPVIPVTDALILSTLGDGVVFVVANSQTPRGAVVRARKSLHNVGAKILGIVLNKVDLRHNGYYGYYGYYGSEYYGSEDKQRPVKKEHRPSSLARLEPPRM